MEKKKAIRRGRVLAFWARSTALSLAVWMTLSGARARAEIAEETAGTGSQQALELVWVDTYKLFNCGFQPVADEVERLLEQLGVEAVWVDGVPMDQPPKPNEIRVFLTRSHSKSWGLKANVLGTVLGNPRQYVYVFVPNLVGTMKVGRLTDVTRSPGRLNEFARAMGRVIVHEIGHVFNPGRPHTKRGLMSVKLTRGLLRRVDLVLDKGTAEYIGLPIVAVLSQQPFRPEAVIASSQQ